MNEYINTINSSTELARLDHQARLVGKVTGLLPALLEDTEFTAVLDIGCGPGRWARDMAMRYPRAEVVGTDLSQGMIEHATSSALASGLQNVSFEVHDIFEEVLPFSEGSFDLINLRFALGWVKGEEAWEQLLQRCRRLLKPGGWMMVTEGEGVYTTSWALIQLHDLLSVALHEAGYGLSHLPGVIGVVASLGSLLHQVGFDHVQNEAHLVDYSYYNEEENRAWRDNFHVLINELTPFMLKERGITSTRELALIDQQLAIDLFQEGFCGVGPLFTFFGRKPEETKNDA